MINLINSFTIILVMYVYAIHIKYMYVYAIVIFNICLFLKVYS